MKGITIYTFDAANPDFDLNLIDLLRMIGKRAEDSTWKISYVEAIGYAADEIHKISDDNGTMSGQELFRIASDLVQVIDGEFEACLQQYKSWLVIRAIDGTEFDVECEDESILNQLTKKYPKTINMP